MVLVVPRVDAARDVFYKAPGGGPVSARESPRVITTNVRLKFLLSLLVCVLLVVARVCGGRRRTRAIDRAASGLTQGYYPKIGTSPHHCLAPKCPAPTGGFVRVGRHPAPTPAVFSSHGQMDFSYILLLIYLKYFYFPRSLYFETLRVEITV